jgi:hypothetical protein
MIQLLEFVFTKVNDVAKVFGPTTDVCSTTICEDSTAFTAHKIMAVPRFNDILALTALAPILYHTI